MRDKANKGYHKLLIWKKAYGLVMEIYKITKSFPKSEEFSLVSQLRRASISIVLNIVEGNRRSTKKDFLHFLNISQSSLTEVEAAVELSFGLKFINETEFFDLDNKISELAYLIGAFVKALKKP